MPQRLYFTQRVPVMRMFITLFAAFSLSVPGGATELPARAEETLRAVSAKFAKWFVPPHATAEAIKQNVRTADQAFSLAIINAGADSRLSLTLFDCGQTYRILETPMARLIADPSELDFSFTFGGQKGVGFTLGDPNASFRIVMFEEADEASLGFYDGRKLLTMIVGYRVNDENLSKLDPHRDSRLKAFLEDRLPATENRKLAEFFDQRSRPKFNWLDQVPSTLLESEEAEIRRAEITHLERKLRALSAEYLSFEQLVRTDRGYHLRIESKDGEPYFVVEHRIGAASRKLFDVSLARLRPEKLADASAGHFLHLQDGQSFGFFGHRDAKTRLYLSQDSDQSLLFKLVVKHRFDRCDYLLRNSP